MRQGISRSRLNARETCDEKGWAVGTMLTSSQWRHIRIITKIGPRFVHVKYYPDIDHGKVTTFPPDVEDFAPTLEKLKARCEPGDLDEHVHEAKSSEASSINNDGFDAQLAYLVHANGMSWVIDTLLDDA